MRTKELLKQMVNQKREQILNRGYYDAGVRTALEKVVGDIFSDDGIHRALVAYEKHTDLSPEDRMAMAIAAAMDVEEHVAFDEVSE